MLRIDPAPGDGTTVAVGDGPDSIVAGADAVWVSNEFDATSTPHPLTGTVERRVATGGSPRGLALVGGSVRVASASFASDNTEEER